MQFILHIIRHMVIHQHNLFTDETCFYQSSKKFDWEDIKKRKQERICKSNVFENSNRIDHDFKKGDSMTLVKPGQITWKFSLPREGPYKVIRQCRNGSITSQISSYETKK